MDAIGNFSFLEKENRESSKFLRKFSIDHTSDMSIKSISAFSEKYRFLRNFEPFSYFSDFRAFRNAMVLFEESCHFRY